MITFVTSLISAKAISAVSSCFLPKAADARETQSGLDFWWRHNLCVCVCGMLVCTCVSGLLVGMCACVHVCGVCVCLLVSVEERERVWKDVCMGKMKSWTKCQGYHIVWRRTISLLVYLHGTANFSNYQMKNNRQSLKKIWWHVIIGMRMFRTTTQHIHRKTVQCSIISVKNTSHNMIEHDNIVYYIIW